MVTRLAAPATDYVERSFTWGALGDLYERRGLTLPQWQRAPRWSKADQRGWLAAALRGVPVLPVYLREVVVAGHGCRYDIIDGQNRIAAMHAFVVRQDCRLEAETFLARLGGTPPAEALGFADLTPAEQRQVRDLRVPAIVFRAGTDERTLRRVFASVNKGKTTTSQEIIHSWTDLPAVCDVLNPVDAHLADRVHRLRPGWRARNHRMLHTWAHVWALLEDANLYLVDEDHIQTWIFDRPRCRYAADQVDRLHRLCQQTVDVLAVLQEELGQRWSLYTLPDVAWAMVHFPGLSAAQAGAWRAVVEAVQAAPHAALMAWRGETGVRRIEAARQRRRLLAATLTALAPERYPALGDADGVYARSRYEAVPVDEAASTAVAPTPSAPALSAAPVVTVAPGLGVAQLRAVPGPAAGGLAYRQAATVMARPATDAGLGMWHFIS